MISISERILALRVMIEVVTPGFSTPTVSQLVTVADL